MLHRQLLFALQSFNKLPSTIENKDKFHTFKIKSIKNPSILVKSVHLKQHMQFF